MSIPAHKPSEPAEVTDLSALFEFAEEATLDQAAPAAPAASRAVPTGAAAGGSRDVKATRAHVDAGDEVAAIGDRRDEAQAKSNLEEILGGDLPLDALEPRAATDVLPATAGGPSVDDRAATPPPAPRVKRRGAGARARPPLPVADAPAAPAHQESEPASAPPTPELRLALGDSAIAEPEPSEPTSDLPEPDADFELEPALAEPIEASAPEVREAAETLTVADLLALGVELSWQEAVSVVLEWLQGWDDPDHCPDPSAAALREGGRIELLSAGQVSGPAVPAAAMLLTDLLGSTKIPPQLREMLENDRAVPSEHVDLAQFTSALSYFGRPNRRVDLAAVHTRLHESRRRLVAEHELSRLRARVVAVPSHAVLPAWLMRIIDRAQESPLTFVLWLLVGMNSLAFLWIAMSGRSAIPPAIVAAPSAPVAVASAPEVTEPEPARQPEPPTAAARRPRSEGTQPVQARTASAQATPAAPTNPGQRPNGVAAQAPGGSRTAAQANARVAAPGNARPAAPESSGAAESNTSGRPGNATTPAPAAALDTPNPPRAAAPAPTRAAPERPAAAERRRVDDLRLYSSRDADVTPPRLLRPTTHTPELTSSLAGEAAEFELVVGPTGRVERVRMITPSDRLEDKMLLAAAKAWEFDPAVRDGVPVWYRLTVRIP